MADAVEVAIEAALLKRATDFAAAESLPIALPNVAFTPPANTPTAKYLRATFLPADSFATGISLNAHNQHYGLLQIDVFYGQGGPSGAGGGEIAPGRIASAVIAHFPRGLRLTRDGFRVEVSDVPRRGALIPDAPWVMIPVRIPYRTFARPT
jgi:hypothetical protein